MRSKASLALIGAFLAAVFITGLQAAPTRITRGTALVGSLRTAIGGTIEGDRRRVEAHTAGDTLTTDESGSIHTNAGASGTLTIALPAASDGLTYTFVVRAVQQLRIDPNGTQTVSLPSTGVPGAAGKYLVADAIGETVVLVAVGTNWQVLGYTGTWTAEP